MANPYIHAEGMDALVTSMKTAIGMTSDHDMIWQLLDICKRIDTVCNNIAEHDGKLLRTAGEQLEQLRAAIREADSLGELLRLVGPSDEEMEASEWRCERMAARDLAEWELEQLEKEQRMFEERYW